MKRFDELGVGLAFISVDSVEGAERERATYQVPFPLLSDQDAKVHAAFRVVNQLTEEQAARLKGMGLDVRAWSSRGHLKIGIPSLFLIGADGIVRWSHAARDHRTRPAMEALIAAVEAALPRD